VWCCGCGCSHCVDGGESAVTRPQKRKLVEERKKKTYKQAVSQHKEHSNAGMSMSSQSVVGPGRPSRERATCCVPSLTLIVVANHNLTELFSYLFSLF
jgi:hypothetical protein